MYTITTVFNEKCIEEKHEDYDIATLASMSLVEQYLIETYGEAYKLAETHNIPQIPCKAYFDGDFMWEGYYTVIDCNFWGYNEPDYQWYLRVRGIDYDTHINEEDEENDDWE